MRPASGDALVSRGIGPGAADPAPWLEGGSPRPSPRRRSQAAPVSSRGPVLAVATAAIALAAAIAVPRLSADEVARDQPAIAAASPVTRDGLRLAPLPGWSAPPTVPSLPGLGFTAPIVLKEPISGMMLIVGLLPAMSRTLVPPDLEERLQAPLGRPDTVVLEHGFEAYHYPRVTLSGTSSALDLYLIPTTAGVVTAARGAPAATTVERRTTSAGRTSRRCDCSRVARCGSDPTRRSVKRLPGSRSADRRRARQSTAALASRIPAEQAAGASRVAAAYERAAAALLPLAPPSSSRARAILRELTAAGSAYRALVVPLRVADPADYERGSADVRAHELRLEQLIEDSGRD